MRRSPLAILALATASLFPGTLSAHSRHARLAPAPRQIVAARDLRSSHVQHPQPLAFRGAARNESRRHAALPVTTRRAQRGRALPAAPRARRAAARGHLLLAVNTRHANVRGRYRPFRDLDRPLATRLDSPAQQTPVVSIIRPTTDRPQLPSIQEAVTEPIVLPALYNDRGRLIVPAPLLGSHEILVRQNELADQDGLGRVQDDADLDGMRARGMLVALPASEALHVDDRLPYNRRFCRAWTAQFLANLSRDHYARFHTPLQLTSAVRTVEFQVRLQRTNGNAAPAEGDTASPHLTGQAIDIGKRGLSLTEIAWLRGYLLPLIQASRVDVEEEFQQSCFHISVYQRYLPPDAAPQRYAVTSRGTSALAAALR